MSRTNLLIVIILSLGIIFRLFLTSGGNFLFNMDNGRDMVDVREMVTLRKLRLTGPNSAIEGVFNGPAWYYLLAIPFILSAGNPYASIIIEIILWAIGGFFLLKLTLSFGKLATFAVGGLWIASDYVVLTNLYAFNPNPIILLTPLFIYLLHKYIETQKLKFSILTFFLGGLFFNFEMNFGFLILPIIFVSLIFTGKFHFFVRKHFWIGIMFFLFCLLPQAFFDLRHNFIMIKSVLGYLSSGHNSYYLPKRFLDTISKFFDVFSATLLNNRNFTLAVVLLLVPATLESLKKEKNNLFLLCLFLIIVPLISYLFIPTVINPWHLGAEAAAFIILIGFLINRLLNLKIVGKIIGLSVALLIIFFSAANIVNFFTKDLGKPSEDPSRFKNEIAAIDYVYKKANGKNFKVYVYLPSVIDYPYQYLIWWYGLKKYGYLPADYAYAPNKPEYISNKSSFSATKEDILKRPNSNLVFLIKEPNLNYTRYGWEGDFVKYNWKSLGKQMVGPLEIETRKEVSGS